MIKTANTCNINVARYIIFLVNFDLIDSDRCFVQECHSIDEGIVYKWSKDVENGPKLVSFFSRTRFTNYV